MEWTFLLLVGFCVQVRPGNTLTHTLTHSGCLWLVEDRVAIYQRVCVCVCVCFGDEADCTFFFPTISHQAEDSRHLDDIRVLHLFSIVSLASSLFSSSVFISPSLLSEFLWSWLVLTLFHSVFPLCWSSSPLISFLLQKYFLRFCSLSVLFHVYARTYALVCVRGRGCVLQYCGNVYLLFL